MSASAGRVQPTLRVQLALDGALPRRDLTPDEVRQLDAAIAVRVDDAAEGADFTSAPLPDFTAVLPDPHRVLVDLAARAEHDTHASDRLREALTHVERRH